MYNQVTVALDGSKLAEAALVPAAALAREHAATVRVVSVASSHRDQLQLESYHQALQEDGVLHTDSVYEVLDGAGHGTAAVLHKALGGPGELLCLATRGHGAVGSALLGSVAEAVLARHPEPVLLVGPSFRAQDPVVFRTLLLCLDGSRRSEKMIPHAAAWAEELGMSIEILHVAAPAAAADAELPPGRGHVAEDRRHEDERAMSAYLGKVAVRLTRGDVRATWKVVESENPAGVICEVAGTLPGAVVALATRGANRLALGSIAMKVAHDSPVPVLVLQA